MSDLRDLYQEVILDHGKRPRNFRHPADANREAKGDNPLCGDKVTIYLKLSPANTIEDVAFEGRGCAISTASASLMTEAIKGKDRAAIDQLFTKIHTMLTDQSVVASPDLGKLAALSGVREFPARVKCASLCWHTLNAALEQDGGTISTE